MPMNKWMLEPSTAVIRRAGKTGEEAAELGSVCARIVIQGINETDPSSGKTNRQRLLEEMADVQAQIECTAVMLLSIAELKAFNDRVALKVDQMREWEDLLRGAPQEN